MEKRIIQVEEKVPAKMLIPLSIQHMFAMFGASVLVPFLFGISPAIVLLMNGVGTLLFIFITKGKAPAYLGSSFAFLSPALLVISKYGYEYALGGFVVLGIAGMAVAFIVRQCGTDWIDIVLPTAAMGPVVALIGLELAKMYQLPFYDRKKVSDLIRSKGTLDRFPDFYGEMHSFHYISG